MIKNYLIVFIVLILIGPIFASNGEVQIYYSLESIENPSCLPVLLVFLNTNCPYCYNELFEMQFFIEQTKMNILLIGVACESQSELETFLKKYSFKHPVINDVKMKIYRRFKAHSPFKIVLVKGQVAYQDNNHEDITMRGEKAKIWLTHQFLK